MTFSFSQLANDFFALSGIEQVTFVIAVLGFSVSVIHGLVSLVKSLELYDIRIIDYRKFPNDVATFFVSITNFSSRPLVITSIKFSGVECELEPKRIKEVPDQKEPFRSAQFPLCVPAHGAQLVCLEFVGKHLRNTELNPEKEVILEICSTLQSVRKTLPLGQPSHYLHSRKR